MAVLRGPFVRCHLFAYCIKSFIGTFVISQLEAAQPSCYPMMDLGAGHIPPNIVLLRTAIQFGIHKNWFSLTILCFRIAGAKMVQPLVKVKSVKKRTNRFKRHQSDRKIAVKVRCANEHRGTLCLMVILVVAMKGLGVAWQPK
jgi:hypothetical protein